MSLSNFVRYVRAFLVCGLIFLAVPALAEPLDKPSLFEEALVFSQPEINSHALRSRSVIITDTSFTGMKALQGRASGASSPSATSQESTVQTLKLNLFDDLVVDVDLANAYQNNSGSQTWVGKIQTDTVEGIAAFVIRDGQVYGNIDVPGRGSFSIRPGDYDSHIIEEIDSSQILTGETDAVIPGANASNNLQSRGASSLGATAASAAVAISNDDGSIIDVYVGAHQSVDGAAAQSMAELFIAYTNQAYENSEITQRVWLVGDVDSYNYTTVPDTNPIVADRLTDEGVDLAAAQAGTIPGLHAKRDEHHADLVLFFRPFTSGQCTGLGFVQETNTVAGFEHNAFSVMQACSFGSSVFAHELGHNMGGRHDWYVDDISTPKTFAHGYIDTTNSFKTIMSYDNRCIALTNGASGCATIPQFSNPSLSHNGHVTGVAEGTSSACVMNDATPNTECDADNTRTFNETAVTTSKFRDSKVIWTGATSTDWGTASNWATARIPRSYDNVAILAGLTNYPIITGAAEARELTIQSGATLAMSGGALTVGWAWEDAGGFTATGGTVKLAGPIGVTLTSSGSFHNLEIGTGSDTSKVTLDSNLDVNGDFTVKAGANFIAGAHQLNIAGSFADQAAGFKPGASTVVFDGTAQTVDKVTTQSLLNETFANAVGDGCCSSAHLPVGWARSADGGNGFQAADFGFDGAAIVFNNSSDSWLISTAVTLSSNTSYTLQFDYRKPNEFNNVGTIESVTAYYGASQASSSMVAANAVGNVTGDANFSATFQNKQASFTVPVDGTYYIGFNVKSTNALTMLDNIKLDGISLLQFNNVKVASGETDFLKNSEIAGNLEVGAGATADLGANSTTVEGTVTNNGEIKQTFTAPAATTTSFVSIKNADGSADKYYGVEITPSASLGSTVVSVKGNQTCTSATGAVSRCYSITPTTSSNAAVKFYYLDTEVNGNTLPVIESQSDGSWTEVSSTITRGAVNDSSWVNGAALTASGEYSLDDIPDTIPDDFSFTSASDLPSVELISNSITVTGIDTDSPISITGAGGEYSIDKGAYTNVNGTVSNGAEVTVRNTTAATTGATVDTVLTIGTVSGTYTITTDAPDIIPDTFTFTSKIDVPLGGTETSNTITVSGINGAAAISIVGGSYKINTGDYTSEAGTVDNGDTVTLQQTTSAAFNTPVNTVLTMGGVSGTFTTTTEVIDTTPIVFAFTDANGALVSSLVTSNAITVTGINSAAAISIVGGSYKIDNGVFTNVPGTINSGQTVTVQNTAPGTLGSTIDTVLTIGGVSDTFTTSTGPADTTPDGFTFTDVTGVVLTNAQTSNAITVAGINAPSAISVTGGTYSIGNGAYTNVDGTVNNGDTVTVQHTASGDFSTAVNTVLTIGGVDDTYTSTTEALDATPDAFTLTGVTEVALGSLQTSNSITVTGINTTAAIGVTGGSYKIGTGSYTSAVGTVSSGDTVTVQHAASSTPGATVDTVLTIGGVTSTYSSTAIDTVPDAFTFTDVDDAPVNSVITSNVITISGISSPAEITITGGSYKIDNGTYTNAAGTVNDGETVTLQNTTGALGTAVDTVLTVGGINDTFTSTTAAVDTTPESFTFVDVTGVVLSSAQISNAITVSGINSSSAISVVGGTYSIDGGAYISTDGTIENGQTVTVQHDASGTLGAAVNTVLTIGGVGDTYTSTTIAPDTTPDAFAFTDVTSVVLGDLQTSSSITVSGINTTAEISVTGGSYQIGTGSYTTATGTVSNGDVVTLQHTASSAPGSVISTVLTIGGVSDTYSSTTIGPDTTPTAFAFTDVTEVALSSTQTSNTITVEGINTAAGISVTGGSYQVNSGAYTTTAGTVNSGDTVTVQHTASDDLGVAVDTVLTIGVVSDTYTSTTEAPDTAPDAFTFAGVTGAALSSTQTSSAITVSGINTAAAISVTGGTYSIDGGAYTSAAGTISSGSTVTVQHTASAIPSTDVDTVLTIGDVSDTYTSTSEAPDTAPEVFTFIDATGVGGSTQTSASVTVGGINTAAPISVFGGGRYSINGGAFTDTAGVVNSGDIVAVQHTLAAADGATVDTELTIGGVIDTYTSTTVAASTITPIAVPVSVPPVGGASGATVPAGAPVVSAPITVAGLIADTAPISVTNGEYRITPVGTAFRGGVFTSEPGFVRNGDVVELRHNASSIAGGTTSTSLKLGAVTTTFVSTSTELSEEITGTVKSGGGSMGTIGLMFLSMFTLLCITRRRRLVKGFNL